MLSFKGFFYKLKPIPLYFIQLEGLWFLCLSIIQEKSFRKSLEGILLFFLIVFRFSSFHPFALAAFPLFLLLLQARALFQFLVQEFHSIFQLKMLLLCSLHLTELFPLLKLRESLNPLI